MDNDFVRALTETMIVDNERMWDRIFKRIQNISALNAFIIVCIIQYGLIGLLFAGPELFSSRLIDWDVLNIDIYFNRSIRSSTTG